MLLRQELKASGLLQALHCALALVVPSLADVKTLGTGGRIQSLNSPKSGTHNLSIRVNRETRRVWPFDALTRVAEIKCGTLCLARCPKAPCQAPMKLLGQTPLVKSALLTCHEVLRSALAGAGSEARGDGLMAPPFETLRIGGDAELSASQNFWQWRFLSADVKPGRWHYDVLARRRDLC